MMSRNTSNDITDKRSVSMRYKGQDNIEMPILKYKEDIEQLVALLDRLQTSSKVCTET